MDTPEIVTLIIICVILVAVFVWLLVKYDYNYMKGLVKDAEQENAELSSMLSKDFSHKVDASDKLLSFIEKTCTKVAIIKFQEFIDANEISKITESMIRKLVSNTAKESFNSVTLSEDIIIDESLYTYEFITKYMIDCCSIQIKSLWNNHLQDLEKINR